MWNIESIVFDGLIETVTGGIVIISIISVLVALIVCDDNGERQYFVELLSYFIFCL